MNMLEDKGAKSAMEAKKKEILTEMAKVKKHLYKEEAKSAIFALAFAANMAVIFAMPFTFLTVFNIICALYMFGFFKPTIKKQEQLHSIVKTLKDMLDKIENPPEPQKPAGPWKT